MAEDIRNIPATREPDWLSLCESIVESVGTLRMADVLFDTLSEIVPLCELSAWSWPEFGSPRAIVATGTGSGCGERTQHYASRYFQFDPIGRTIGNTARSDWIARKIDPGSIANYQYVNECYVKPAFVEKLTLARWSYTGWCVLNLYRNANMGKFSDQEQQQIGAFSRILLPLLAKHYDLTVASPKLGSSRHGRIERLTQQIASLNSKLTPRELSVCACTAIGLTAQSTAQELGIKVSSVLTYRRRAYDRLSISSGYELTALLM
jgi:DNA-binding CsgD family transcriptional regulator